MWQSIQASSRVVSTYICGRAYRRRRAPSNPMHLHASPCTPMHPHASPCISHASPMHLHAPPMHLPCISRRRRPSYTGLQPYASPMHLQAAEGTFFEQSESIAEHITKLEQAATLCGVGCNPMWRSLQPCSVGCNPIC